MEKKRIGFWGLDIIIDKDLRPYLIEINGSNSGFNGLFMAYRGHEDELVDRFVKAFNQAVSCREVYVVQRLANLGKLPNEYLWIAVREKVFSEILHRGVFGTAWAQVKSKIYATQERISDSDGVRRLLTCASSMFKSFVYCLGQSDFLLRMSDFSEDSHKGRLCFCTTNEPITPLEISEDVVLWFRTPSPLLQEPRAGLVANKEFPWNAFCRNKWLVYQAMKQEQEFESRIPRSALVGAYIADQEEIEDLMSTEAEYFIYKPLMGSQAKGIEILSKNDVSSYRHRLQQMREQANSFRPSLEILLASNSLIYELRMLSELIPSKPVQSNETGHEHYGTIRSLAITTLQGNDVHVHYVGGYWRLAPVPICGDGFLWSRYIASFSQGSLCQKLTDEDEKIVRKFTESVLEFICKKLAELENKNINNFHNFLRYERDLWHDRYKQLGLLQDFNPDASSKMQKLLEEVEKSHFLTIPSNLFSPQQLAQMGLPYLISEPHRIQGIQIHI